jgi:hypothetical protein
MDSPFARFLQNPSPQRGEGLSSRESGSPVFTPKALYNTAQGRERSERTLGSQTPTRVVTPKGLHKEPALCNPFGVDAPRYMLSPRVRCATLGCGVQPLRGKDRIL